LTERTQASILLTIIYAKKAEKCENTTKKQLNVIIIVILLKHANESYLYLLKT